MTGVIPAYVFDLNERLPVLLDSYRADSPGWYRLCNEGNLVAPGPKAGLGFSALAAKVAVQCGVWQQLPENHRQAWIAHIQSFQTLPDSRAKGQFVDPTIEQKGRWLYWRSRLRQGRWQDLLLPNWHNRWAETRQALSALSAMGATTRYAPQGFPVGQDAIYRFLDSLPWERNPWAAGAQAGHLLFFLRHGQFSDNQRHEGFSSVVNYLNSIESPESGGWYRGDASNQQVINGAMKIISGLYWWNYPVRYAEQLLATALSEVNAHYDCALVNRLFVLFHLKRQLGELPREAYTVAQTSLETIPQFFQPDGGLASGAKGSLKVYYYARVSKGQRVGDLHGLALLTWAIALSAHILDEQESLCWHLVSP